MLEKAHWYEAEVYITESGEICIKQGLDRVDGEYDEVRLSAPQAEWLADWIKKNQASVTK